MPGTPRHDEELGTQSPVRGFEGAGATVGWQVSRSGAPPDSRPPKVNRAPGVRAVPSWIHSGRSEGWLEAMEGLEHLVREKGVPHLARRVQPRVVLRSRVPASLMFFSEDFSNAGV